VDPGPISIILLSPVYFTRTVYLTRILLSLSTRYAHTLCFKQTSEIDNLIASWKQSTWLCVCRFHVAAHKAKLGWGAIYKLSGAVAKLASITFSRIVCSSPERLNLGFLTEGNLLLYSSHLPLGVPNGLVIQLAIRWLQYFWSNFVLAKAC
jgi:hypothetical protein